MLSAVLALNSFYVTAQENNSFRINQLKQLLSSDQQTQQAALTQIDDNWQISYVAPLLEITSLTRNRRLTGDIFETLSENTGQDFEYDIQAWYHWLWNLDYVMEPEYGDFKAWLFANIDPKFENYFDSGRSSTIRLDEVRWGGVQQDGIPPLRYPEMIAAQDADYLQDSNVVFGIEVNGDLRAYPKRILAWHEMFVDDIAGVSLAGVYCTLCGSMILYETRQGDTNYEMGTSGFLYRSNKLMYDSATQSLWNTMWGKPVVGPLADFGADLGANRGANQGIQLNRRSVVTTTWGEWRRRHPTTTVLSLNTGHRRNYDEGVAYREYFATDELMFNVPELDTRLKNKDEVLGLVFPEHPDQPLAISADYLADNPLLHERIGEVEFVVITDVSGANRVYQARYGQFVSWNGDAKLVDANGSEWRLTEAFLGNEQGEQLPRLAAHRAFWFGWYGAYSQTRLIQ